MAEQTLNELVMNLINWIESLHEKNLKYEAQVETLSRDLAKAQNSNEELEARLSAYQNNNIDDGTSIKTTVTAVPIANIGAAQIATNIQHQHLQHQPTVYQSIGQGQGYAPQPPTYVSTYDTSGMQTYYDQYWTPAFQQP